MEDTRRPRRPVLIPALLILTSVLVIAIDRRGDALAPARGTASVLYGSVEAAALSFSRWSMGAERVQALELENSRLNAELLLGRERDAATARTGALLNTDQDVRAVAGRPGYTVVPAQVIAFGGRQGHEETITIDAGSRDGVSRDVTVMNAAGLVGRVTRAGPDSATVLLATDASSSVGTRMAGSGELGLVTGLPAEGLLRLRLLNPRAPLQAGQRVLTLGSEDLRPYVPGVPVGSVVAVETTPGALTRTALVRPFAKFSTLDAVAVVMATPRADPGHTEAAGIRPTPPAPKPSAPSAGGAP